MTSIQKPSTKVEALVAKAVEETKGTSAERARTNMQRGSAAFIASLSPALAKQIGELGNADRSAFDAAMAKHFFSGIAALATAGAAQGRKTVTKDQVDFSNATIGLPDPKKALRCTINLPAGFRGPDDLVYPASVFKTDASGAVVPNSIEIGKTKETIRVRPGDAIVDSWSGAPFKGKGFLLYNEADSMLVPVPADGIAVQILVNGITTDKLADIVKIFENRDPGSLSVGEMKGALTNLAINISRDIYLAETADYATHNLDAVDVSHPGIGLHSKKGVLTSAVRIDGAVDFNSPDAGTGTQSFADGAVIIKTTVKNDDGSFREVVRGINPTAFDADGYKDTNGNPITAASLPKAIIKG